MPFISTLSHFIPRFYLFSDKTPAKHTPPIACNQKETKSTPAFCTYILALLSKNLPSNVLTGYLLGIFNPLYNYQKIQVLPEKSTSIKLPICNETHADKIEDSIQNAAACAIYEAIFAGKAGTRCAVSALALVKKEPSTRSIDDLIAAGLIQPEQLEEVSLSAIQHNYLCSDQVIVALFEGLQADYKDLAKLPDHFIKNLLGEGSTQNEIKTYLINLMETSLLELKNGKRPIEVSRHYSIQKKDIVQNPWIMQICTTNWYIPIHLAIIENDLYLMRSFLKYDARTDYKTNHGSSLLSIAAQYGQTDIVKLLLDKEIPTDLSNKDGDIPLHFAAYYGHDKVVDILVRANPKSVNQPNYSQLRPLHLAALSGNDQVTKTLLEYGAEMDAVDAQQCTALHMASATGRLNISDTLLEAGASTTIVNIYGERPLQCRPKPEYAEFNKPLKAR